jgi:hypothetical protein
MCKSPVLATFKISPNLAGGIVNFWGQTLGPQSSSVTAHLLIPNAARIPKLADLGVRNHQAKTFKFEHVTKTRN